jgi:predicted AAA+ superfamily ATPase
MNSKFGPNLENVTRLFNPPRQSYFLFGPRGTGKSTWTQKTYPGALRVNLLDPAAFRQLTARPELLREWVAPTPADAVVVIDEVQKIPELLGVVHDLIVDHPRRQFVLTGSSARKLKRAGVDLLAGRALHRTLHPFMAAELGKRFALEQALTLGLLPVVWGAADPKETLDAYVGLYLKEEVQAEGLVRNLGNFSRFLEAMSFSHGGVLNQTNIARECGVGQKTVEGFVSVLTDLLLGWGLPVYSRRAKRKLASHPKFYFADTGVFRSLRPAGPTDARTETEGQALEGLVAQHLLAWAAYSKEKNTLHFWRTSSGTEVDFVVQGENGLWAVEVKNTSKVRPEDVRGLNAFREDYPTAHPLLLYRGHRTVLAGGILCLPCEGFLANLKPNQPLPRATGGKT